MEKTLSYINGFNDGYVIRKIHPILFKKLMAGIKSKTPYFEGYEAGGKQYEKEIHTKIHQLKDDRGLKPDRKDKGLEI